MTVGRQEFDVVRSVDRDHRSGGTRRQLGFVVEEDHTFVKGLPRNRGLIVRSGPSGGGQDWVNLVMWSARSRARVLPLCR